MEEAARTYDPLSYSRNGAASPKEQPGGGVGLNDKNPTPTLRIFNSNMGSQWLMYGGVQGGDQDENVSSCTWFTFLYRGIIKKGGKRIYRNWMVTVTGDNLEVLAHKIGKQISTTLRVGDCDKSMTPPLKVDAITIAESKIHAPEDDEPDAGFQPDC